MVLVAALVWPCGCAKRVDMSARGGETPHTTIPYTGVRNDGTRFEDYSVVDGSILEEKSPRDARKPRDRR